mmetsp:Transcript_82013/g.232283  ORF Transcript_82013/g.232283 Transcript_82013/m.232283 type:complete len:297 (+) Transcript_82013:158-1048(+)
MPASSSSGMPSVGSAHSALVDVIPTTLRRCSSLPMKLFTSRWSYHMFCLSKSENELRVGMANISFEPKLIFLLGRFAEVSDARLPLAQNEETCFRFDALMFRLMPVRPWSSSSAVVANASIDCDLRRSPEGCGLCAMPPGAGAARRSALSSLAAAPLEADETVRVNMLPWSSTTVSVRELKFPSFGLGADGRSGTSLTGGGVESPSTTSVSIAISPCSAAEAPRGRWMRNDMAMITKLVAIARQPASAGIGVTVLAPSSVPCPAPIKNAAWTAGCGGASLAHVRLGDRAQLGGSRA